MIQPMCLISALSAHVESTSIQLLAMSKLNHELSIFTKTFSYKDPLADNDLWRKTNYGRRRLMAEDDLLQKTTYGERRLLTGDDF